MSSVAANVRRNKEAHPERYCADSRCLWRTDEPYCPNHAHSRRVTAAEFAGLSSKPPLEPLIEPFSIDYDQPVGPCRGDDDVDFFALALEAALEVAELPDEDDGGYA
jgi:hypothetical protein